MFIRTPLRDSIREGRGNVAVHRFIALGGPLVAGVEVELGDVRGARLTSLQHPDVDVCPGPRVVKPGHHRLEDEVALIVDLDLAPAIVLAVRVLRVVASARRAPIVERAVRVRRGLPDVEDGIGNPTLAVRRPHVTLYGEHGVGRRTRRADDAPPLGRVLRAVRRAREPVRPALVRGHGARLRIRIAQGSP